MFSHAVWASKDELYPGSIDVESDAETPVTMDNSHVASCQNFLMSLQSASNLDLYFSPWKIHYVYMGKTILKFNKREHTCKKPC